MYQQSSRGGSRSTLQGRRFSPPRREDPFIEENREIIASLSADASSIYNTVKKNLLNDKESDFLESNRGKELTLLLKDGRQLKGVLEDIRTFFIIITIDSKSRYYYKHALIGYSLD